jgi:hypothetical protein
MQGARLRRVGLLLVTALAMSIMFVSPASAVTAGVVGASFDGDHAQAEAVCAYTADLADTDPDNNTIVFTAVATSVAKAGAVDDSAVRKVPFATGVNCWLDNGGGSAGLSMVGPVVAAPGSGTFGRFDRVNLCVTATVLYTDGTSDSSDPVCDAV